MFKRLMNVVFFLLLLEVILFPLLIHHDIHKETNRDDAFDVVVDKYEKYNFLPLTESEIERNRNAKTISSENKHYFESISVLLPVSMDKKLKEMIINLSDKWSKLPPNKENDIRWERLIPLHNHKNNKDIPEDMIKDAQDILYKEEILKLDYQIYIVLNLIGVFILLLLNYIFFGKITLFHKK